MIPFSNVDEAVAIANDTEFGLSGSVRAGDLGTGMNIADRMATEHVHVNDNRSTTRHTSPSAGRKRRGWAGTTTGRSATL